MKNRTLLLALVLVAIFQLQTVALFAQDDEHGRPEPRGTEPQMTGIARARDARGDAPPFAQGNSPLLTNHGGPVLTSTVPVNVTFWGPGWGTAAGQEKQAGIEKFYQSVGGSNYIKTNSEFSNGTVTSSVQFILSKLDSSSVSTNGNQTGPILTEVCKQFPSPTVGGYYPVYVDIPRGNAGFCAWHSAGTCNGKTIEFAFFFNLDGDSGCDPGAPYGTYDGKTIGQGLGSLVNVTGHELSETVTDPLLNAWYDKSGQENSDKCAWVFPSGPLPFPNGTSWKIQGNWSNNAYNSPTRGYKNRSGQKGCIDGGLYN